jgi:hypothetical protein
MRKLSIHLALLAVFTLSPACGDDGGGDEDTTTDTMADAPVDTMEDMPMDSTVDMPEDTMEDMPMDSTMDMPGDTMEDMATDEMEESVVSLTVASIGVTAYDFTEEDPPGGGVIGSESENQTLTLTVGTRYQIVNLSSVAHPFELLDMGGTPGEDVVLLSESAAGSWETDTDVDWFDDGSGTIRFTLTSGLAAELTGYRCAIHVSMMRGSIGTM